MHVVGRDADGGPESAPTGHLGHYLARDGSVGASVGIDLNRPHAGVVVGKRGAGKSHTIGVLAEGTARAPGVAPVVVDPMGAFAGLASEADPDTEDVPGRVIESPTIRADALPASQWPELVGLDPTSGAGALVWEAAAAASTLGEMVEEVVGGDEEWGARRAAGNHLRRAREWDVFDPDGLTAGDLFGPEATVLSLAGVDDAPTSAVVAATARLLYDARTGDGRPGRLPWLFVDEAHVAVDGVAGAALRTLLTRGRAPGVSLVLATQRPSALPEVATSQADLLIAHRLTSESDIDALTAASPTYLSGTVASRLPSGRGEALLVDDATESTHTVRIRDRHTPHGGHTPRASEVAEAVDGTGAGDAGERRESDRCERSEGGV